MSRPAHQCEILNRGLAIHYHHARGGTRVVAERCDRHVVAAPGNTSEVVRAIVAGQAGTSHAADRTHLGPRNRCAGVAVGYGPVDGASRLDLGDGCEEDVLLVVATYLDPSIRPGHPGIAADRALIVVVADVARLNAGIDLLRLRTDRVAHGLIGSPSLAIVRGLDDPVLVAVVGGATSVVPGSDYVALWSGRQRGHPLTSVAARGRITVEDNRSRPGVAVVGGADVEDVALIPRIGATARIDIVDHAAWPDRRLAPPHVPPNGGNKGKVAPETLCLARAGEGRSLLNPGPAGTAVEGAE